MRRAQASIGLFLVLGGGLLAGCGSAAAPAASGRRVAVSERDFHIDAPRHVPAGNDDLAVDNQGPDAHELILVRGRGGPLPLRSDGLTVDEEALKNREVGALEPGNPGAMRDLDVDLKPGHYELFCNMYGHYEAGMHTSLVVR